MGACQGWAGTGRNKNLRSFSKVLLKGSRGSYDAKAKVIDYSLFRIIFFAMKTGLSVDPLKGGSNFRAKIQNFGAEI